MSRIGKSFVLAAFVATIGATGLAAPVMAKETRGARVVHSAPLPERTSQERSARIVQVDAMRKASIQTGRSKIVPGSDSVGEPGVNQTLAVATGFYGR